MSLDTVLKIGKAFREAKNGLKWFRYVNPCPRDTDKNIILRLSLKINQDFSFDFENISEITNENIIGSETEDTSLYYLTFKTSDKDNNPIKYIFGDIYYGCEKGKEKGWYKSERKEKTIKATKIQPEKKEITVNSYYEGNKSDKPFFNRILSKIDDVSIEKDLLKGFHQSFGNNLDKIEAILKMYAAKNAFENLKSTKQPEREFKELFTKDNNWLEWSEIQLDLPLLNYLFEKGKGRIFLHFDFSQLGEYKYWHQYKEIFTAISNQMQEEMTEEIMLNDNEKVFAFKKSLYRNICSGDDQGDKQFPNFDNANRYKSFVFKDEDVKNLYFGINSTEKGLYLGKDLITIILLPNGDNLTAKHYERFQKMITSKTEKNDEETNSDAENLLKKNNESIFNFLDFFNEENESLSIITQFDVIFVKQGQNADNDLIEISNIERSFLNQVFQNIKRIKNEIYQKIEKTERFSRVLSILYSLQNILGRPQTTDDKKGKTIIAFKPNPKYQSHLLKVLPRIYTANYTNDSLLLPSFVQNVEYSIRHGDPKYTFLKYDLEFLLSIQNTTTYKANYMKITESQSYEVGLLLGRLARNFAGENSPIKSFEKNYVGNLTRRIATLSDFITLKGEIEEKLIMHEKTGFTKNDSSQLTEKVKAFSGKYDKNECAFGFFESYFQTKKKSLVGKIESILEYHNATEEEKTMMESLKAMITNTNNS